MVGWLGASANPGVGEDSKNNTTDTGKSKFNFKIFAIVKVRTLYTYCSECLVATWSTQDEHYVVDDLQVFAIRIKNCSLCHL